MSTLDDLLDALFEGNHPTLRAEIDGWLRGSRRYRAFVTTYRDKIRTKLRNARDEGSLHDVRAELDTAQMLLRDERFTLEYEIYAAAKQRGPDFTVTFRTHTPFNVEVRRLRGTDMPHAEETTRLNKLIEVLCDKIGQMPPSSINLLWLAAEREITEADLVNAITALRQLAERKVEDFFTRRGYESAADFLKHFRQLSGTVRRAAGEMSVWLNPQARYPAPPEIITALKRLDSP